MPTEVKCHIPVDLDMEMEGQQGLAFYSLLFYSHQQVRWTQGACAF